MTEPIGPPATWRERIDLLTGGVRPGPAQVAAAVVAVLAAAVALFVWLRPSPPPPELSIPLAGSSGPGQAVQPEHEREEGEEIYVHAAGAVVRPGVYRLPPGTRVADLVDAAGGLAPGAAPDLLNLAAEVVDGQQVYVPRAGERPPPGAGGGGATGAPAGPLDLNTATAEQLEELPGVGPATARAILDHRERHGPFASVDELLEVRGIGEAKLEALRDLVRV